LQARAPRPPTPSGGPPELRGLAGARRVVMISSRGTQLQSPRLIKPRFRRQQVGRPAPLKHQPLRTEGRNGAAAAVRELKSRTRTAPLRRWTKPLSVSRAGER
jgi:hypothetical protein